MSYNRQRCLELAASLRSSADLVRQIAGRDVEGELDETAALLEGAVAEIDRASVVTAAAVTWRERKYPHVRSWLADCDTDMDLVSAVDTYKAGGNREQRP